MDKDGHKCWDSEELWGHILEGIRTAVKSGRAPRYLGIDTWGVDFVLLDKDDRRYSCDKLCSMGECPLERKSYCEGKDDAKSSEHC